MTIKTNFRSASCVARYIALRFITPCGPLGFEHILTSILTPQLILPPAWFLWKTKMGMAHYLILTERHQKRSREITKKGFLCGWPALLVLLSVFSFVGFWVFLPGVGVSRWRVQLSSKLSEYLPGTENPGGPVDLCPHCPLVVTGV